MLVIGQVLRPILPIITMNVGSVNKVYRKGLMTSIIGQNNKKSIASP